MGEGEGEKGQRNGEDHGTIKLLMSAFVLSLGALTFLLYWDLLGLSWVVGGRSRFVVFNARVLTIDDALPRAEAFLVEDGRFADIGSTREILARYPGVEALNAKGNFIMPGIIDAHAHLLNQGRMMIQVDLFGSESVDEVLRRLHEFVEENPIPEGGWLLGRGWDQNLWGGDFPTKEDLDAAFPSTPIYLRRVDGHACWCNSEALRIIPPLPEEDPEGGTIIRDESGEATGVFIDNAMWLVEDHIPEYDEETLLEALQLAIFECNRLGITSVHDAGIPKAEIDLFKKAIDRNLFNLRNYGMLACANGVYFCPEDSPLLFDYGNRLTVRSVKVFLDGALGSWGAAMIEPYSDKPETTGLLRMPPEELAPVVLQWAKAGYQVNTHCIGDQANRLAIDAYEAAIKELGAGRDLRLRLEHAQIISPEDIGRIVPLNIIPSFQPTHATSDMGYAEDRVGPERILGAYAWQTLASAGAKMPLGSDFPVERVSPFLGIYAAVTRQDAKGNPPGGWYPEQRLTMMQTLKGFTLDAAYAAFQEGDIGSISVGKWADFIILDRDLTEIAPPEILDTRVLATFLEGRPVFVDSAAADL